MLRERARGFIAGLVAGAITLVLSFLLRFYSSGFFLPELAAQTLFSVVPGEVESRAIETLGQLAKYSAFVGAIVTNLILYGVLGSLIHSLQRRWPIQRHWARVCRSFGLAYAALLALGLVLLGAAEVLSQPVTTESLALYLLPPHLLYGLVLEHPQWRASPRPTIICEPIPTGGRVDRKRRLVIGTGLAGAVSLTVLFYGIDLLFPRPSRPPVGTPSPQAGPQEAGGSVFEDPRVSPLAASEITPNDRFYKVDVNLVTPFVEIGAWRLSVRGLVDNPLELTYDELKNLPSADEYATLECVSNEIGGDLISNALWRGVKFRHILEKAQARPEAVYIILRCQDGYDVGIPMERGLLEGTLLAYEMNGAPLPEDHGFPVRLVVPGLYGMMNAKWITEVELVDKVHEGFWQRRGWANNALYQTHSAIATPGSGSIRNRFVGLESPGTVLKDRVPVAGIAFAGDRGIARVEVSADGGSTWIPASIKDPLSDYTWVLWSAEWNPPAEGEYRIMVRATDRAGNAQIATLQKPYPSGATGYHVVNVRIEFFTSS